MSITNLVSDNMPAVAGATTSSSLLLAGAAGAVPDGVHPLVFLVSSIVVPIVTAFVVSRLRVRDARQRARKIASAAELRLCAERHETEARARLEDADKANDADAPALMAKARQERIEAAADEAEAEQILRESERRP